MSTLVNTVPIQTRISKNVLERRSWAKFGEAKGSPPGPEQGITTIDEERELIFCDYELEKEKAQIEQKITPIGKYIPPKIETLAAQRQTELSTNKSTYVPPALRNNQGGTTYPTEQREEKFSIMITNLPEDSEDYDIRQLCQENNINYTRLCLIKSRQPPFKALKCYVDFRTIDEAKKAASKLTSTRLNHMILSAEYMDRK